MNTTSAAANRPLNSPMVSSSSTPGRRPRLGVRSAATAADSGMPRGLQFLRGQVETLRLARRPGSAAGRGWRGASSRKAAITASSSSGIAGFGGRHGAGGHPDLAPAAARPISAMHRRIRRRPARASKSYLKLPAARVRSGGAPSARKRPRMASVCARIDVGRRQHRRRRTSGSAGSAERRGRKCGRSPAPGPRRCASLRETGWARSRSPPPPPPKAAAPAAPAAPRRRNPPARRTRHPPARPAFASAVARPASVAVETKSGVCGQLGPQPPRKFHARQHLAHRNCMQPDGARAGLSKGARKEAEALRQASASSARFPQAAEQEIQ